MTILTFWILQKAHWQEEVMLPLLAQRAQPLLVSSKGYLAEHVENVFCDILEFFPINGKQLRTDIVKTRPSYCFKRLNGAISCHLLEISTLKRLLHGCICRNGEISIFPLYNHIGHSCCLSNIFCKRRKAPLYSCLQRNYGKFCSIAIKSAKETHCCTRFTLLEGNLCHDEEFALTDNNAPWALCCFFFHVSCFQKNNKNYPLPTLHSISKVSWDSTQSVQIVDVYAQAYTDVY